MFRMMDSLPKYGLGHEDKPDDLLSLGILVNPSCWLTAAIKAPFFQLLLALYAEGLMITTIMVTGKQTVDFSHNPLFETTSPSDFWGKRWNLVRFAESFRESGLTQKEYTASQTVLTDHSRMPQGRGVQTNSQTRWVAGTRSLWGLSRERVVSRMAVAQCLWRL